MVSPVPNLINSKFTFLRFKEMLTFHLTTFYSLILPSGLHDIYWPFKQAPWLYQFVHVTFLCMFCAHGG